MMRHVLAAGLAGFLWGAAFGHTLTWDYPESGVCVEGPLAFASTTKGKLDFVPCPEGYPAARLALVSTRGEIAGYAQEARDGSRRSLYVHQVGSGGRKTSLEGTFAWDAVVTCDADAIPCRVRAPKDIRVFSMGTPGSDSLLNNALFLRTRDVLVEFEAEGNVRVETLAPGRFRVYLTGANNGEYACRVVRDYFRNRNMPHYKPINRTRAPHAPTGWMAWNIYFDQATAEDNLREARAAAKLLKPYGLEIWSIESWQGNSDILPVAEFHNLDLSCDEKEFPQGMKAVADEIRALGFKPGLWIVPWGTGNRAFYEAHRDWFVHEPNGKPTRLWPGRYILDITNDAAREHVRKMIRTYAQDWGFEFFKIDGMGAGFGWPSTNLMRPEIKSRLAHPDRIDPVYTWVHTFREAMGETCFFLACGAALTSPGLEDCDATRIGGDIVHPDRPVQWDNVLAQALSTVKRYYSHNIVAWNDPDTLMVDPKALTLEEARVTTTVVGLPGQVMFSGDKIAELPPERLALVRRDLPVADTRPMDLFPFTTLPPIWNLAVKAPWGTYHVVALFNWGETDREIACDFASLGLDPAREYALYETWTETWCGTARGAFSYRVPRHAVRLFTVQEKCAAPLLLATDRHITQGYEDILAFRPLPDGRIALKLKMVAHHPVTVRVLDGRGRVVKQTFEEPVSGAYEKMFTAGAR